MQVTKGLSGWFFTLKNRLLRGQGRSGSGPVSRLQSGKDSNAMSMTILGHELRNPLNGILGMTQLIQQTELSHEQRQWLRAVHESGVQMRNLIDSLGDPLPEPNPETGVLDGVGLLEQIVLSHTPATREKGIDLLMAVDEKLSRYWYADTRSLRQIVDNLLGNAIKFTETGHVWLEARGLGGERKGRADLELLVLDTGIGISATSGRKIFRAYHTAGGAAARRYDGKGLGLHICRRIAEKMNGSISYESRRGSGSCFCVRLPGIAWMKGGTGFQSGLLTSQRVLVCTRKPTSASIHNILARLGVHSEDYTADEVGPHELKDGIVVTDTHCLAKLGSAELQTAGGVLVLAPGSVRFEVTEKAGWKLLRPPFLECTVGPALMEIALARRMSDRLSC